MQEGWKQISLGCLCVLQVILAYESIVLCMCSGNVLNGSCVFPSLTRHSLRGTLKDNEVKQKETWDDETRKQWTPDTS